MKRQMFANTALVLIGAALVAACVKPAADAAKPAVADTAKIATAVKSDVQQLIADFNTHDAAKAVSHDAPGMVGMFHGAPNVIGPDADLAMTKKQVADPAAKVAVSDETVDVSSSGDMAVYRAAYAFTMTNAATKKPMVEKGNWIIGYKPAADGIWKIAWNVVSNTGAAAPAGG